jgi:hypothetical protein
MNQMMQACPNGMTCEIKDVCPHAKQHAQRESCEHGEYDCPKCEPMKEAAR